MGVPLTATRFCLQPDTAFYFAGHELRFPAQIKTPLAIGVEAVFSFRLWQTCQANLLQQHVLPIDGMADAQGRRFFTSLFHLKIIAHAFFLRRNRVLPIFVRNCAIDGITYSSINSINTQFEFTFYKEPARLRSSGS